MLVVAVGIFASLAVVIISQYIANRPSRNLRQSVRRLRELGGESIAELELNEGSGMLKGILAKLGVWALPKNDSRSEKLRIRLALGGYNHPSSVMYFMGLRLALVIGMTAFVGGGAALYGASGSKAVLLSAAGGTAGFLIPSFALSSRISSRQRKIRNALPDALDIMVLSVESGSSLNAAITWVTEEIRTIHPLLEAEMLIVQKEIQLGLSAGDAFLGFADRCGITEVRDLAAALLQSEKYGASVGKALRAYSDAARLERQLWAEEVAQKAAVKIMFPMLVCIFPAMFIVLLGPAAFQLSKLFAN